MGAYKIMADAASPEVQKKIQLERNISNTMYNPETGEGEEGYRQYVYDDATGLEISSPSELSKGGNATIGVGYKLRKGDEWMYDEGIDDIKVQALKKATIAEATELSRRIINQTPKTKGKPHIKFDDMPLAAQEAIVNMVFNNGSGEFATWTNTRKALVQGNYLEASKEIFRGRTPNSKSPYGSGVTANRAKRVAKQLASA
jgi:GH24 family phage-related lysozyme (muramidase)